MRPTSDIGEGESTQDAMRKVWKEIQSGSEWIVEGDLKDFFGSVDHEKLLALVAKQIACIPECKRFVAVITLSTFGQRQDSSSALASTTAAGFLDFVLSHYVRVGVEELDQEKLTPLLRLKYHISDALADKDKRRRLGRSSPASRSIYISPRLSPDDKSQI